MYSCGHFSEFLSYDPVRKQSAMSKRGQKTTSNESSPTAKAKSCLVLREQRDEEISSRCLGFLVNPCDADDRKEVVQASKQLVQPESNSEVGYSQTTRQENVPQASRKLVRGSKNKQNVMKENTLTPQAQGNLLRHHHNMEYTNHQYMKIFQFLPKKLGMPATDATLSMEAY